ncbi:MAG: class I SAM-dependent methyltransferase [Oscillospiraceae bacterium]|nr:class I SAM-dependent methyltransferase [Oscillospiraceae bacterium]
MALFDKIRDKAPLFIKDGVPHYGSEREGDQFRDSDIEKWTTGGHFARRWRDKGQANEFRNDVYMNLCRKAAALNLPLMDIACGPNLGLLPDIIAINPNIQALATDACPILIEKWHEFLRTNAPEVNIELACFNAADMPIRDNSVDTITSSIGFGSLRYAGVDQMDGIGEAYRVLKPGGYIFAIEGEFEDNDIVQKTFDLWGKENWFGNDKLTWVQRFKQAGFVVEEETWRSRSVDNDWDLGDAAASFGLEIAVVSKAYILRKR